MEQWLLPEASLEVAVTLLNNNNSNSKYPNSSIKHLCPQLRLVFISYKWLSNQRCCASIGVHAYGVVLYTVCIQKCQPFFYVSHLQKSIK
jgi:hypothetical protein